MRNARSAALLILVVYCEVYTLLHVVQSDCNPFCNNFHNHGGHDDDAHDMGEDDDDNDDDDDDHDDGDDHHHRHHYHQHSP